jgi:hypothetical protein
VNSFVRAFFVASLLLASPAFGAISVGNGGVLSLGDGALDLAGGNLTVDGQFQVANGSVVEAGDVVINGALDGGNGALSLRGDWINNGSFNAGSGQVSFTDDAGSSAQIIGNTTFYGLSLLSSAGGAFVLQSGTVQRVISSLVIQGAGSAPVQIESSNPPQIAGLLLEPGGSQNIADVGVSKVYATGQPLAPNQTNQGGAGNDRGWFGLPLDPLPVPVLSIPGLLILMLALLGVAFARRGSAT